MKNAKTGLRYFYDTYALVEVFKGNPNYAGFVIEKDGATSRFNLMELYRFLLRTSGKKKANEHYDALLPFAVEFDDEDIKGAVLLKEKNKDLSYIDCLGYSLSLRLDLKFLTGDREFSGLKSVEFVK